MLWRVRMTLPDRPGALAVLAANCGDQGVNIMGLQIFPGIESVTDELVLRCPDHWGLPDIAELVESSGGESVSGAPCTEQALVDQPARYVQAARTILAQPAAFPEVVARLFDAESDPAEDALAVVQDVMEMQVGEVQVQVRRTAPFTATEHARGSAMADLVSDVLARGRLEVSPLRPNPSRRLGGGANPAYVVEEGVVTARVEGTVVAVASLGVAGPDGAVPVSLRVDPAWQRRGIGTRLLIDVGRLANANGIHDVVLTTRVDNQAVLPMVLAAGLKGRIRMSADVLTVRIPVHDLKPLPA
ncbi:aromatic ring-opening dioxygenase LigA [Nocardioides sp. Root151]|nr:aromatic ring-opening dioxygenase LigA [Nocardioides sp. Root151]KRF14396.1 aromatic ring-opening dioxygenase LigA [Nocardioides sp. Soil796]